MVLQQIATAYFAFWRKCGYTLRQNRVSKGYPFGTRLCLQSVVYYMLCRCCGSVNRSLIVPYQSQITKSCTFPCNNNYYYSEMKNINKKSVSPIKTHRWSECRDSNPGPHGPEPCAIPNFATPRSHDGYYYSCLAAGCQERKSSPHSKRHVRIYML